MSDSFSDERADMATNTHLVVVGDGDSVPLNRNDMYVLVRQGSTSTSITTTNPSAVPIGLRVTFDNRGGSGSLSVNSGQVVVPAGLTYETKITSDGSGGQLLDITTPSADIEGLQYGITSGAALQAAITNDKANGVEIRLQEGQTVVTSELDVVGGSGGIVRGRSAGGVAEQTYPLLRSNSQLLYDGTKASGEALINMERTEWTLEHVTLLGKTPTQIDGGTGTRTPIGIRMRKGVGVPTGKMTLNNVKFGGFDTCIQIAEEILDDNCDSSTFKHVSCVNSGRFMLTKNIQGMSMYFYHLHTGVMDTIFEYDSGGKLNVFGAFMGNQATFLRINANPGAFSHNNATWSIRDLDLDLQAYNSKVLDVEPGADIFGRFLYDGGTFGAGVGAEYTGPAWVIGDACFVRITNWHNLQPGMIRWTTTSALSTVIIDHCRAYNLVDMDDIFDYAGSTGDLQVICTNNSNAGTVFADIPLTTIEGLL